MRMKKPFFYGYVVVLSCVILQIIMLVPRNSYGVFINPLSDEFGWSRALISGAFSLSTIIMGISSIIMGWLNDRKGPRIVMTICGILVGSGLILVYWADSIWQLYLFFAIIFGLGMGGLMTPQMSTITRWFVSKRHLMLGLLLAGGGVGGIIGPPLITWLIYNYNWREAFLFIGVAILFLMIVSAQFLKRDPSQIGEKPYQNRHKLDTKTATTDTHGLSLKQALQSAKFWMFSLIMFCFCFIFTLVMVHVVPLAIDRGISAVSAATLLSVFNVAMTAGSFIIGFIADKIGSRRMLIICLILLSGVILFLIPVKSAWTLGIFAVVMSLGGGGMGVLQPTIVAELFGLKSNGVILGVNAFVATLGSALGALIAGLIFDTTGNYQLSFIICAILSITSVILAVFLNRFRKTEAITH
jgi:MFS family permease